MPPEALSPPRRFSSPGGASSSSSQSPFASSSSRSRVNNDRGGRRSSVSFSDEPLQPRDGQTPRSRDAIRAGVLEMEAAALRRSLENAESTAWSEEPPANHKGQLFVPKLQKKGFSLCLALACQSLLMKKLVCCTTFCLHLTSESTSDCNNRKGFCFGDTGCISAGNAKRTIEKTKGHGSQRVSEVMSMGHDMNMDVIKEQVKEQLGRGDSLLAPDVSSSKGVERQGELPVNLPSARPR